MADRCALVSAGSLNFRCAAQIPDVVFHNLGELLPFKTAELLAGLTVARSRKLAIPAPPFQHVVRCAAEDGAGTCQDCRASFLGLEPCRQGPRSGPWAGVRHADTA